ncbi:MAG TPA: hypothetical protein VLF21_02220 [Candidatus Saccharimonadales bacterium]|nr:hypothetical protein [Candidatus Saccharimonadales bacterium]
MAGVTTMAAALTAGLLLIMFATTPGGVGPLGVTFWFLGLMAGLSAWLSIGFYLLGRKLQPKLPDSKQKVNSRRRGVLVGGYISVLLGLSSLHQLGGRDALLLGILIILVEFYLVTRK